MLEIQNKFQIKKWLGKETQKMGKSPQNPTFLQRKEEKINNENYKNKFKWLFYIDLVFYTWINCQYGVKTEKLGAQTWK